MRFSAAVTFASLHVIPRLPSFIAKHPHLRVEAILDDRNVDLIGEGIDVALRMGVLTDSTMTARRIGQSRRVVLGTPAYFKKAGEPSNPAELVHHAAVIYAQRGGGTVWTFRRDSHEETITLNDSLHVAAAEGVRARGSARKTTKHTQKAHIVAKPDHA